MLTPDHTQDDREDDREDARDADPESTRRLMRDAAEYARGEEEGA